VPSRAHHLIVVAALAATGCSASPPPSSGEPPADFGPPEPPAQMSVLMLTDGQDATLVAGAQGGFHVWLSYAVRGAAGSFTLERDARRVSDGAVVLRYRGPIDVGAPDGDGWWTVPSPIPMFMCPTPIGISIVDEPIAFSLRLLDDAEVEHARADITLVPRCPDAQRDFCTRICTG
jgi:hypothetical protein